MSRNLGYKRGGPIFEVWDGGKRERGDKRISKMVGGGTKVLHNMNGQGQLIKTSRGTPQSKRSYGSDIFLVDVFYKVNFV